MKTDRKTGGSVVPFLYRHPLLRLLRDPLECLENLADPVAKRKVRWTPHAAALAAVLMAIHATSSLAVRCADALACLGLDFRRDRRVGTTYNGLLKALRRQAATVLPILKDNLHRQSLAALELVPRTRGYMLLAVDGTKEDLPRTWDHERGFGIADNGHCPQAFVTTIVEVHTGLALDWRIDRADASERYHLLDMIQNLPDTALLLADGNFVGYPIWSQLHDSGKKFLIRVGGNVSLIQCLWPDTRIERDKEVVYVWPVKRQEQCPPLRLRLIRLGPTHNPVYLLTNVLEKKCLGRRAAGAMYRLRWGIELFYRTFKRTLGYVKLRSRSARHGRIELEWGLIASVVMIMIGIRAVSHARQDPRRLSPAGLVRALRVALYRGRQSTSHAGKELKHALSRAVKDEYHRKTARASRHRPITRNTPFPQTLRPPKVRKANDFERQLAQKTYPVMAA